MSTIPNLKIRIMQVLTCIASALTLSAAAAGTGGYQQSKLVSDQAGMARFADTNLVNPWGFLAGTAGRLIVADNHAGAITFYTLAGRPVLPKITIPTPTEATGGAITDLTLNRWDKSFVIQSGARRHTSTLLFVTEDGTIGGWTHNVNGGAGVIAVDNSAAGAIYKSLALVSNRHGPRLFAANFGQGLVEMYDQNFHLMSSFTDTNLATAGYVPFGLRAIAGELFVTFAFKAAPGDGDEKAGPGLGYLDEFDLAGNFVRRVASQGTLNAPWGLALAPRKFGKFGGALLVGNFGDGTINVFDAQTSAFLGQVMDAQGNVITIDGLWALAFGPGGGSSLLYFTAGPQDENHGLLGTIRPFKPSTGGGYSGMGGGY